MKIGEYLPDLLPCPFCGGDAELSEITEDCDSLFDYIEVRCSKGCCHRQYSRVQKDGELRDSHITKIVFHGARIWNTRTPTTAP